MDALEIKLAVLIKRCNARAMRAQNTMAPKRIAAIGPIQSAWGTVSLLFNWNCSNIDPAGWMSRPGSVQNFSHFSECSPVRQEGLHGRSSATHLALMSSFVFVVVPATDPDPSAAPQEIYKSSSERRPDKIRGEWSCGSVRISRWSGDAELWSLYALCR